ncbi:relaxase/mobilization nuclease domain-containing protein [Blautia obeum]
MAYTSIIPVSRLDNSITYIRNKDKTTKKGQSAGSLEEAIDYAMNRDKTERSVFEDAIGCVCETAYQDMVATKKRYHKMDGVQGYHLVQSFVKGEVTPELAHQIGMEMAERLLQGKYEAVITTHLNTEHYHNHIVFNSVSMEDGKKYHSNSRSYYEDVRKASDALCLKYGLSVIEPKNGKGKSYAQWMAEQDGKPTWRTSIRLDIRDAVAESFTWKQFLEQMKQRGYQWKLNRKYIALKAPGMERYIRLRSLGKHYSEESIRQWILQPKSRIPAGKEGDSRFPKGYSIQKAYDISQIRTKQPEEAEPKPMDQLMEALLTDSEVRIQIADNLPDKVQAQYIPNKRTIYVRNGMSENATFHSISRELACASLDHHDGSYSRAGVSAQAYCAAYVTAQKYGVDVSGFSFDKVCQMQAFGQKDPKELRSFIQDVKSAAYSIGKQVDRNLGKSEQEFMTDEFAIPEEKTEKPAKSKKSPER